MDNTTDGAMVAGYAEAIVTVAKAEGVLDRVEDSLYGFARVVEGNAELRQQLTDPGVPVEAKMSVVDDLLGGHPQTAAAVMFVMQSGRGRQLGAIADEVARLAAAERSRVVAEVRSAVPLGDEQRRRLADALSQASGRDVSLKVVVDPTVVGGLVARVGDTVIDGTVSRRLAELRARLTGA